MMTARATRIVVADDHYIARVGTLDILRHDPSLEVVGEAADGAEALALCRALLPDLAILDMKMPRVVGTDVARALHVLLPPPRIMMLSAYGDAALVRAALDAGATGYALKSVARDALLAAIHRVLAGERTLVDVEEPDGGREPLSERERVVLRGAARGLKSRAIALDMGVSERTVETYFKRAYQKLDVATRAEAVTVAQREHLLGIDTPVDIRPPVDAPSSDA